MTQQQAKQEFKKFESEVYAINAEAGNMNDIPVELHNVREMDEATKQKLKPAIHISQQAIDVAKEVSQEVKAKALGLLERLKAWWLRCRDYFWSNLLSELVMGVITAIMCIAGIKLMM